MKLYRKNIHSAEVSNLFSTRTFTIKNKEYKMNKQDRNKIFYEPGAGTKMDRRLRRTLVRSVSLFGNKKMKIQEEPNWYKFFVSLCVFVSLCFSASAQQATWIWYPGDYEIWLSNNMQN